MKNPVLFKNLLFSYFCICIYLFIGPNPATPAPIANSFRLPLEGDWIPILQDFAVWNSYNRGYHLAEDVERSSEVPVYASANGIVRHAALRTHYGYVVIIEHQLPARDPADEYVCTLYGHMRPDVVPEGTTVSKGDIIGHLSSNPEFNGGVIHTHFGIRKGPYLGLVNDPKTGHWYYAGYTVIFNENNRNNPVHQEILSEWFDPYDFVKAHEATGTLLTLQEAASQGLIELESKGGYFGDKVTFTSGPNPENVIVKIRKGDAILNKQHFGQNLVASKDLEIFIPAGQIVRLGGIWVVCLDFEWSIPYSGDKFDVTYNIRQWDVSSAQMLYRLLEVIDQEELHEDWIAQDAVWKVTDNRPVGSAEAENLLIRAGIDPNVDILHFPHLLDPNSSSPGTDMVIPPDLPIIPPSLESLIVYPNPFRSAKHSQITFEGLIGDASIRIFSICGALIYEDRTTGWSAWRWNVTNMQREDLARGIYIYLIIDDNTGAKRTGKIAIIN